MASKSDALESCKSFHPSASLLSVKSAHKQMMFEEYLKRNSFTNEIFLGAELKENGHWFWDDGNPIFVSGNLYEILIFNLKNYIQIFFVFLLKDLIGPHFQLPLCLIQK